MQPLMPAAAQRSAVITEQTLGRLHEQCAASLSVHVIAPRRSAVSDAQSPSLLLANRASKPLSSFSAFLLFNCSNEQSGDVLDGADNGWPSLGDTSSTAVAHVRDSNVHDDTTSGLTPLIRLSLLLLGPGFRFLGVDS